MGKGKEKARLRFAAAESMQEGASAKEDVRRSEDVYGQVSNLLGAEGTYPGSSGYKGPTIGQPQESIFETKGTVSGAALAQIKPKDQARSKGLLEEQARGLDVNKTVNQITSSKSFGIASQLTAEASQMMNREGPMYERLQKSITNPILKRGSQMLDDSLEELKGSYARGGRARREGMKDAMKIQAQMEANEFVGSKMVEANASFDQWARDNARSTLAFNQQWASNLQGVRSQYTNSMGAAREFMLKAAIPTASSMQSQADAINQQGKKNWVDIGLGAVMAVAGVVAAPFTGGASLALVAAGGNMMSKGTGGAGGASTGGMTTGGGAPRTLGGGAPTPSSGTIAGSMQMPGGGAIYNG